MTLEELAKETLVEKNRRIRQAKCKHEEVVASTFVSDEVTIHDRFCLDCGKFWNGSNQ